MRSDGVRTQNPGYFAYRLFEADGTDIGEADYASTVEPGEAIWTRDGRPVRVLDLVELEEGRSPYAGFLLVAPLDS